MAKNGLLDGYKGSHIYCRLAIYRLAEIGHSEEISGRVLYPRTMKGMGLILGGRGGGNKRKRPRSPATFSHWIKGPNRSNNLLVIYDLFNKMGCNWALCKRTHKCKECRSKDHRLVECISKGRKKSWQCKVKGIGIVEQVEIVEVASLANENVLCQFTHAYPCFPTPPKLNIHIKFRLADTFKLLLMNTPSPRKPTAWAIFLFQYLGKLRIYFLMILCFETELGYKGPSNAFILSDNLALTLEDPAIIKKKIQKI